MAHTLDNNEALAQLAEAITNVEAGLAADPRNADLHLIKAASLWALGRFAEAFSAAEVALSVDPCNVELLGVKADSLRRLGRLTEAITTADAALALDPTQAEPHWAKADSLRRLARFTESVAAADAGLAVDPKHANLHWAKAESLWASGRFPEALETAITGLAADPKHAGLHVAKARSQLTLNRFADSLASAQAGLVVAPKDLNLRYLAAESLRNLGRTEEALAAAEAGLSIHPDHTGLRSVQANVLRILAERHVDRGELKQALIFSEKAIRLAADDPRIAVTRAWILQDSSNSSAAWQLMHPLVSAGFPSPQLGVLFGRMAPQLKREPDALAFLKKLLASTEIALPLKEPLYLAAAALLDRAGEYDKAFEYMHLGKQANRLPHDRHSYSRWIDLQIAYFTPGKLRALPRASHGNRRPVFIIGMPRSGTSLVEQILASHPDLHGAGELQALSSVANSLPRQDWTRGQMYPHCLDLMGATQANELAATYLSTITAINDRTRYVTDKMPANFALLGLIATLFPDCRVIHCTRNSLDTCLSCYMTAFVPGLSFTHDLTDLGTFYRDCHRLIDHWKTALRYPLIEVNYEQLIGDLENQTRRLLAQLNLPWNECCLRFYENKRIVTTASRYQVRQPAYASSVGRWKHYEKHLAELISALAPPAHEGMRP